NWGGDSGRGSPVGARPPRGDPLPRAPPAGRLRAPVAGEPLLHAAVAGRAVPPRVGARVRTRGGLPGRPLLPRSALPVVSGRPLPALRRERAARPPRPGARRDGLGRARPPRRETGLRRAHRAHRGPDREPLLGRDLTR